MAGGETLIEKLPDSLKVESKIVFVECFACCKVVFVTYYYDTSAVMVVLRTNRRGSESKSMSSARFHTPNSFGTYFSPTRSAIHFFAAYLSAMTVYSAYVRGA